MYIYISSVLVFPEIFAWIFPHILATANDIIGFLLYPSNAWMALTPVF
jgi:hypothetical protein